MNSFLRPRLTIIITTCNQADALAYAIESVVWQTFKNFELWVIGDECSDHSEDIVNSFCDPRIFWLNTPQRVGDKSRLIYEATRRARGEYIAYLDDTDLWLPNHLEVLMDTMDGMETDVALSIIQHVHSPTYSTLSIPLLPFSAPDHSSLIHRKNPALTPAGGDADGLSFGERVLQQAGIDRLKIDVAPVTTGLKFLCAKEDPIALPQKVYMEKLKKDPDFVNRQLSAILLRGEQETHRAEPRTWAQRLGTPVRKLLQRFTGRLTNAGVKQVFGEPAQSKRMGTARANEMETQNARL
jgi:glycosyltransferase involved in cell wall biosynthesis